MLRGGEKPELRPELGGALSEAEPRGSTRCAPGSRSWRCSAGRALGRSPIGGSAPPVPASPDCLSHPAAVKAASSRGQSRASPEAVPRSLPPRLPLPLPVCPSWLRFLRLGPLHLPSRSLPLPAQTAPPSILPSDRCRFPTSWTARQLTTLVFLHGLFGSKANFNSIAKALAQQTGRRVSFWSRRGPEGGGVWVGRALERGRGVASFSVLTLGRRVSLIRNQRD